MLASFSIFTHVFTSFLSTKCHKTVPIPSHPTLHPGRSLKGRPELRAASAERGGRAGGAEDAAGVGGEVEGGGKGERPGGLVWPRWGLGLGGVG